MEVVGCAYNEEENLRLRLLQLLELLELLKLLLFLQLLNHWTVYIPCHCYTLSIVRHLG